MKDRIKYLRQYLGLSQERFGYNLGVSRSVINNLERGTTELKDPLQSHLCSIYNVNPDWLLTGSGEMILPIDDSLLSQLQNRYNLSDTSMEIVKSFLNFSNEEQEQFISLLQSIVDK